MIEAPITLQANSERENVIQALDTLNRGIAEKKIWNVEVNDAKFTLSYAVERALDAVWSRYLASRGKDHQYEPWQDDFSSFCSFNQAAGRIKRLTKKAPKTKIVQDYIEVLKEVDAIWQGIQTLKPFIQKGRRPNKEKTQEQIEEELKGSGTCAICGNLQKIDASDKIVHHGYKMSGYNHTGYRMGKCFGTGYKPYEFSNEANVAYAPVLRDFEIGTKRKIRHYKSGDIDELSITRSKWNPATHRSEEVEIILRKGTEEFSREIASRIALAQSQLRMIQADIKTNNQKIKGWKPRQLPYGR